VTSPRSTGRSGYVAAIVVNIGLIFVFDNLLEWNVLPFLTQDFTEVVGLIKVSLGVSIVVNVLYLVYDEPWFKSLSRIVLSAISLAVAVLMYRVFPFDFTPYGFDWTIVARTAIIVAIVGTSAAILVDLVKLARYALAR
jgi:uncharacterized membrane protein YesL